MIFFRFPDAEHGNRVANEFRARIERKYHTEAQAQALTNHIISLIFDEMGFKEGQQLIEAQREEILVRIGEQVLRMLLRRPWSRPFEVDEGL
jgi:hypothetical protein